MRHLASVQLIDEVVEHTNADALELAKINGWQCVIKKNEFNSGDLGVYFEIDSFLPAKDSRFHFLERIFSTFEGELGARIKTIKLRGEISQGLILPLSIFPEIQNPEIGMDVTELLGVKKYERPLPSNLGGVAKGNFPSFIEKTDQERIQNLKRFDTSGEWEQTEKLDGSSLTIYFNEGVFGVCSRNLDLQETETNTMWQLARKLKIDEKLKAFGKNIALQGEILGGKIQGNRYELSDFDYFIFDVYDIDNKKKMLPEDRKEVINILNTYDDIKIKEVPNFGYVALPNHENWVSELIKNADGQSVLNNKTIREGFVYKHKEKNVSFKVISNKFLLKYDE